MDYADLVQQTNSVYEKDGWDAALNYINSFISGNPNIPEAYVVRSEVHRSMGNFQKALDDAEKAIKINPEEAATYTNRAIVYLDMKEFQKAISDCTKSIELMTNDGYESYCPYYNRGLAYMNIGETAKALDDFNKVIDLDPEYAQAYFKRGLLYAESGNYINEALEDFNEAIELDENFAAAYGNRGNIYLKLGNFHQAINDSTKSIDLMTGDEEEFYMAYYNRGLAYVNLGELEKALEDYSIVIELVPENAEAYAKRGYIYGELGKYQEAIHDLEKFLELDPNNKNAELVRNGLEQLKNDTTPSSSESYEVATEKKELKVLLILSAIGFVLGALIGTANIEEGGIFFGMWFGIGIGGALSFIPGIPGIFKRVFKKDGFIEAIKVSVGGSVVWFILFMLAGPIGLIVRVIKKRRKIKNLMYF